MPQAIVTNKSGITGCPFSAVHILSLNAAVSVKIDGSFAAYAITAKHTARVPTSNSAPKSGYILPIILSIGKIVEHM